MLINIEKGNHVEEELKSLPEEAWLVRYSDPARALELSERCLTLSVKAEDALSVACATGMKGVALFLLNRREKVIDHLTRSITYFERNPDHIWHSRFLIFYANACHNEGDLNRATGAVRKAIRLAAVSGSDLLLGDAYAMQGMIFRDVKLFEGAVSAFSSSLSLRRLSGDKRSVASSLNQLAYCYASMKEYGKALESYSESETIRKEEGFESDMGYTFLGKASVYELLSETAPAEESYLKGISIAERFGDRRLECHCSFGLGKIRLLKNDYLPAMEYLGRALKISESIGANELRHNILLSLSEVQERLGNYHDSLTSLKMHLELKSSLGIAETVSKMHRESIDLLNDMESSLRYAKRIQNAILPPNEFLTTHLSGHFIILKPFISDSLGGDFYFGLEKDGMLFFAGADCTGHGVPGAMTSMLAHTALRMAIFDESCESPGDILDFCREYFKSLLTPDESDGEINDGMDIALISYDRENRKLLFAAANNPLYQVSDGELTEHCGNRGSISRTTHIEKFETFEISHKPGDLFYFMSDGIRDQFGGPDNKKFGSKRLKELILSVRGHALPQQKDIILRNLNDWMGSESQIDDMLLAGIRL